MGNLGKFWGKTEKNWGYTTETNSGSILLLQIIFRTLHIFAKNSKIQNSRSVLNLV